MARKLATQRGRTLRPVRANAGDAMAYKNTLLRWIEAMQRSIKRAIVAEYRRRQDRIVVAQDARRSPADSLQAVMSRLAARWNRNFTELADKLGPRVGQRAARHADAALMTRLREAGFTVKFQMSEGVRDSLQASVAENVQLIKSIASQHLDQVQGAVMRAVIAGHDLQMLTDELEHRYGITRRRAENIAIDQNSKAVAAITRARRLQLGINEAIWVHSGSSKHPRPGHVRAGAEKRRFNIAEGCLIDGEYIQPGELPNCGCTSRAIIPAFDDDD